MLIRDWLQKEANSKGITDENIDSDALEQAASYVSEASSINASQIDVDVISALKELKRLKLINQHGVIDEQEAKDTIKQLWGDLLK